MQVGIRPLYFSPDAAGGIYFPVVVVEITPEDFDALRRGNLSPTPGVADRPTL